MNWLRTRTRRFAAATGGLAAVEFAMIVPILLIMLLATFDAGSAIAVYMKVRAAAFALGTITNQYTIGTGANGAIQTTDMAGIVLAASKILSPYAGTTVVKITQVKATSLTAATVSWSYATDGSQYTQGSAWTTMPSQFTTTAANSGCNSFPCYYIFAEVKYTYTPIFGYFLTGPIILQDNVYAMPRSSLCVQYISTPSTC